MTLFAPDDQKRRRKRPSTSLRAQTNHQKKRLSHAQSSANAPDPATLSPAAQALFDDVSTRWDLTAPVAAILRLACEAMTRCEQCEQITAREGLTIGDQKGAAKPHPASLLARDHRAQAIGALQRLLGHLGG